MRAVIAIPYLLIEILAFILMVQWLGIGWTIGLLILTFFGGILLAAVEMSRINRAAALQAQSGQGRPGANLGNFGLTAAGAMLVAMPGFVTSILGLLLIIPPTRAMIRGVLAKKLRHTIEDLGVRSFEATSAYRQQASYGSFFTAGGGAGVPQADPKHEVIDEEEIQEWTSSMRPEDFGTPGSDGKDSNDSDGEPRT